MLSWADVLLKNCPVWEEAKQFYQHRNNNSSPNSISTLDTKDSNSESEDEEVQAVEPVETHAAERTIDSFLNDGATEETEDEIDRAVKESIENSKKKMHGELVAQFLTVLDDEPGMSLEERDSSRKKIRNRWNGWKLVINFFNK